MPILELQRRMAEQGRIRLGKKVSSGGKERPTKLDRFRFTSPNERLIRDIAQLYGGAPGPWDNGGKAEWEVVTESTAIPVIAVKGGLSQWMEHWTRGGCDRRCDGERELIGDTSCLCKAQGQELCKPTTRLSVMLRDVETLGVWRLETHGWNAAVELPATAELAQIVGDFVPATLHLVPRTSIREGQVHQFVVPVLDLAVSKQRLVEIMGGGAVHAIGASAATLPAIEAAAESPAARTWQDDLAECRTVEECQAIWHRLGQGGLLTEDAKAAITRRAREIHSPDATASTPVGPSSGEVPMEALWFRVVDAAGQVGMSYKQMRESFLSLIGFDIAEADASHLRTFLDHLQQMAEPSPSEAAPAPVPDSDEPPF